MIGNCGHAGAECIIGNFWRCKLCDGDEKPQPTMLNNAFITPGVGKITLYKGTPPLVEAPEQSAVIKLATQICAESSARLAPKAKYKSNDFVGDRMAWVDPYDGSRNETRRDRLYSLVHFPLDAKLDYINAAVRNLLVRFVDLLNHRVEAVANARGFGDYRIAHLGEFPHVVLPDEGLTLVDSRTVELRIGAFWGVIPVYTK